MELDDVFTLKEWENNKYYLLIPQKGIKFEKNSNADTAPAPISVNL